MRWWCVNPALPSTALNQSVLAAFPQLPSFPSQKPPTFQEGERRWPSGTAPGDVRPEPAPQRFFLLFTRLGRCSLSQGLLQEEAATDPQPGPSPDRRLRGRNSHRGRCAGVHSRPPLLPATPSGGSLPPLCIFCQEPAIPDHQAPATQTSLLVLLHAQHPAGEVPFGQLPL